jgi:hypothetical protein
MLKLVSRESHASRRKPLRRQAADLRRTLLQDVGKQRESGDSTQRAVARARRAIVDAHCRIHAIQRDVFKATPHGRRLRRPPFAELAARLETTHARLLFLSEAVEMEMDRLDIVSADIQLLSKQPKRGE